MSAGSLPKSLAHLVIREDPETGEIVVPKSERRVSADEYDVSPRGESSRESRLSISLDSPFSFKERPSLPPVRVREDHYAPLQSHRSRTPPRPQTSVSPPLRVHDHAAHHTAYTHSYAYIPRSAPPINRPFVQESSHHAHQPHLPRRHSHQPYARPVSGYQQSYSRPSTSTFESYHPSSEIGNPGGRGPISRTTKACDTCRTRKIRCEDGPISSTGEPGPCMRCLAAGIECVFSGIQKKRGPCPGTARPTTTSSARRGSGTSDHTDAPPSPVAHHQPHYSRHLPVSSSARSSVGSINTPHLLTPPEERRSSYGFSSSPRHAVSAPIVPGPSSKWPESPDTRSCVPRLPGSKTGRSLFDADYNLGMRLPAIDLNRAATKAHDDTFGPTSSTLAPILNERSSQFWQRAS